MNVVFFVYGFSLVTVGVRASFGLVLQDYTNKQGMIRIGSCP